MRRMIYNYRHLPGEHCGSTVMRNLLNYYCGLELSESFVFGLGSALEFLYVRGKMVNPEIIAFGRSATLEVDLTDALGIDYREEIENDEEKALENIRQEVINGMPPIVCADVFYMDHREFKFHFPYNRFAVVGFDDQNQKVYIHDRYSRAPQSVSYAALKKSRNPPEYPINGLWGKFYSHSINVSMKEVCLKALKKTTRRMLGLDDFSKKKLMAIFDERHVKGDTGINALKLFKKEFSQWKNREDAAWILSYMAKSFEKFGTGGGNFRRLYAEFLSEAHELLPKVVDKNLSVLMNESADNWTWLSQCMFDVSERLEDLDLWERAENLIKTIIRRETEVFEVVLARL